MRKFRDVKASYVHQLYADNIGALTIKDSLEMKGTKKPKLETLSYGPFQRMLRPFQFYKIRAP